MAKNSEARIKANNKYNDKTYDRINIAVPKGYKDTLQEIAARYGLSVNGYLRKLIDTAIISHIVKKQRRQNHSFLFSRSWIYAIMAQMEAKKWIHGFPARSPKV